VAVIGRDKENDHDGARAKLQSTMHSKKKKEETRIGVIKYITHCLDNEPFVSNKSVCVGFATVFERHKFHGFARIRVGMRTTNLRVFR
jgi:hypothetical protein